VHFQRSDRFQSNISRQLAEISGYADGKYPTILPVN